MQNQGKNILDATLMIDSLPLGWKVRETGLLAFTIPTTRTIRKEKETIDTQIRQGNLKTIYIHGQQDCS